MPFRWRDVLSKRATSRLAWRRKQARHRQEVLDVLAADVLARAPDHVAITGDLTNFATPEEFEAARRWLERLGPAAEVTVSPGNHDALVARGAPERFGPWAPWLGDGMEPDFPHVRVRGPVAIVNLSSAAPTPLHLAQGRLGPEQVARAQRALEETRGLFRVVLVHHPVTPGVVSKRKSLTDAAALQGVLAQTGAELVLHGHAHEAVATALPGPSGPIPVLGVPSASTPYGSHHEAARWHEIEIADGRVTVRAHGVTDALEVEELGAYALA